ncbi:ABC transporter permease [Phyllobacterium sp. TAF24]|uniref:ABC transporter permease n=1 Tax=Phyllobacterium sp. TAF24 TaxID=3233068 RepID=UPI003F959100
MIKKNEPKPPIYVSCLIKDGLATVILGGSWITRHVGQVDTQMREIERGKGASTITIDISAVDAFDTAGVWLVERLRVALESAGKQVQVLGLSERWKSLFIVVGKTAKDRTPKQIKKINTGIRFLNGMGHAVVGLSDEFIQSMHVLGSIILGFQSGAKKGNRIRYTALVNQLDQLGIGAILVIFLVSFVMGAITAQQGSYLLRQFGGQAWVVNLVGVLVLRDTGVLLTAIMIAGRSGSAIAAEIGSMKMRDEIDALTVMGLNPIGVLVFPRLMALVIAVPLLTVISDFAGLSGGMLAAWSSIDISPRVFLSNLRDAVEVKDFLAGLIKAPFMAMFIGIIAVVEGMKVKGSAESLGRCVTSSVVKSIFFVIILDGIFALFYSAIKF